MSASQRDLDSASFVDDYLRVGLRLGELHADAVDAYYGPTELREQVRNEAPTDAASLRRQVVELIGRIDRGDDGDLEPQRRRWLRAQLVGLDTLTAKMSGVEISYSDEVAACYGVRPSLIPTDEIADAHRAAEALLPGTGSLAERLETVRSDHAIERDTIRPVLDALADDFRDRTRAMFGLPDGEHVEFELVTDQPWSGFNYYEGNLVSRVAINCDLPVLSTSIGHLVAHEAYPGHHTEHTLKEVGLVRGRGWLEESIFLIGAPQCLMAEGLADLGIEVMLGEDKTRVVGDIVRSCGARHDDSVIDAASALGEMSSRVRGNLGILLHDQQMPIDDVIAYAERWLLVDRARAAKSVEFMTDPTWRAYISCYVEGLPLCRAFVGGDPARYGRLLTEQLIPQDLTPAS